MPPMTSRALVLHGYRYSVYVRIVRLVLAERDLAYEQVDVNPFAAEVPGDYLALHPFGRVPTLVHDGFVLYETGAITRYLDRAFPGAALQAADPKRVARMDQIMGVVDAYAYWPLVRQVFVHDVVRPHMGMAGDAAELEKGLAASAKALDALETLVAAEPWLTGPDISLADFHLGAMLACFAQSPRGAALLADRPRLSAWWGRLKERPSIAATYPGLPGATQ
jgi:glutathione S-transferase